MSDANVTPTEVEQVEIAESTKLTWQRITTEFVENLKSEGKGDQERNFKTAFKIFREATGLAESSDVGMELTEEFEAKIEIYIKFQNNRGLSKSTYGPRVSNIRALKKFVDQRFAPILHLQTLPKTFGQRLRKLIASLGVTMMSFWRTLPEGTLRYPTLTK